MRTKRRAGGILAGLLLPLILWSCSEGSSDAPPSAILPVGVRIGGFEARVESPEATFATIPEAVAPDSPVRVETASAGIVFNVFEVDDKGQPKLGAQPVVLENQGATTQLDATKSGEALAPGRYLMYVIVSGEGRSRVLFRVQ